MRSHSDGMRIANPDPDRDPQPKEAPPQVSVESRENMGSMLDIDVSSLDPEWKYRFVNVAPLKVARARNKGYVFVEGDEGVSNMAGDALEPEADGRIRVGDLVLMKAPKSVYRERRKRVAEKTKTRLGGQKRKFKQLADAKGRQRYGVPVEVITNKEPAGSKE